MKLALAIYYLLLTTYADCSDRSMDLKSQSQSSQTQEPPKITMFDLQKVQIEVFRNPDPTHTILEVYQETKPEGAANGLSYIFLSTNGVTFSLISAASAYPSSSEVRTQSQSGANQNKVNETKAYWRLEFDQKPQVVAINDCGSNFVVLDPKSHTACVMNFSKSPPTILDTIPLNLSSLISIFGPVLVGVDLEGNYQVWHLQKGQLIIKLDKQHLFMAKESCTYLELKRQLICRQSPPPENRFLLLRLPDD